MKNGTIIRNKFEVVRTMKYPFYIAVYDDEAADREQIREMAEEVCRAEKIWAEIVC